MKYAVACEGFILFHIERSEIFHNAEHYFTFCAAKYFTFRWSKSIPKTTANSVSTMALKSRMQQHSGLLLIPGPSGCEGAFQIMTACSAKQELLFGAFSLSTVLSFAIMGSEHRKAVRFVSESKLRELSIDFAVKTIQLCDGIKGHYSLVNQLERSSTSIGANIREANYAHGKADFIAKLQIALKECYETEYWLELFVKAEIVTKDVAKELYNQCGTIRRILISSINTAKNNSNPADQK